MSDTAQSKHAAAPDEVAPDEATLAAAQLEAAQLEAGRKLFAGPCEFVAGAASIASLPPFTLPEVAFAGRSNVGKSSLVNALTGRKTLARTSSHPGHTRQLNFFDLGGRLMLVDLPGYGFAQASKGQIAQWTGLTIDYLKGRPTLKRVLVLIDSRHGVKDKDQDTMRALDKAAVNYQLVLTKTDQIKPAALAAVVAATVGVAAKHGAAHPQVLATSSQSGEGIAALRAVLAALADPAPSGG
jgi:GTP-binding protein